MTVPEPPDDALEGTEPPPPIPPAELDEAALCALFDQGDLEAVERGLREQIIRLPAVLDQLNRSLEEGRGNLAVSTATMLISEFRIARANELAERALDQGGSTAGTEELVDLAAALLNQDRLRMSRRVVDYALEHTPDHGRAHYLLARLFARRGRLEEAFKAISRVSPDLLESQGLAIQARYAVLCGRDKAAHGALELARKRSDTEESRSLIEQVERMAKRIEDAGVDMRTPLDLRTAIAAEYGSILVELSADPRDGGRFDMDVPTPGTVARTIQRIGDVIRGLSLPIDELVFANEDGENVAAALGAIFDAKVRSWRRETTPRDGMWLCMGSAATHPHLPNPAVTTLQHALESGLLRTLAVVIPAGSRGPIVPDVVGRIAGDDELPWQVDDEIEEILETMIGDVPTDEAIPATRGLEEVIARFAPYMRMTQPPPRPAHSSYHDETPSPRAAP